MLNKVKIVICGKDYTLQTEEPPSYVYGLSKMLERKINELCSGNSSISQYSAAIMVSMSILDDLNRAQSNLENVRQQAKEYVDEAGKARLAIDNTLKELVFYQGRCEKLENEMKALNGEMKSLRKEIKRLKKNAAKEDNEEKTDVNTDKENTSESAPEITVTAETAPTQTNTTDNTTIDTENAKTSTADSKAADKTTDNNDANESNE